MPKTAHFAFASYWEKLRKRKCASAAGENPAKASESGNNPSEICHNDDEKSPGARDGHSTSETNVETKPSVPDDDDDKKMEGWNPMEEAYNDPKFNSYDRGPGAGLPSASDLRSKGYVKLHVGNVPKNLSELAMRNIFSDYGKPIAINIKGGGTGPGYGIYSKETNYAFVVYGTLGEAKAAMDGLRGLQPYNFKISFAHDKAQKEASGKFPNFDDAELTPVVIPPSFWDKPSETPPSIIVGKPPSHFRPEGSAQDETKSNEHHEQEVFCTFSLPKAVYLHHLNMKTWEEKKKEDLENASMRQQEISNQVQEIKRGEGKKRRKNIPAKKLEHLRALGKCVLCGSIPFIKCGRCAALYCSSTCVKVDGERHEPLCQLPGVNGHNEVDGIGIIDKPSHKHAIFEELKPDVSVRYAFLKVEEGAPKVDIVTKPVFENSRTWQLASTLLNRTDIRHAPMDEDFFVIPAPNTAERMADDGVPQPPFACELAAKIASFSADPDMGKHIDCSIPESDFTEVTIVHREGPGDFWVLTKNGIRQLLEFIRVLDERSPRKGSVVSQLGRTFGYHHNGNWCRIAFTSYTPFTGFLVDYGYSIEINPNNLLPLSPELEGFPPLAVRIRLADDSATDFLNKKINDSLTVKTVEKLSNGAVLVSLKSAVEPIPAVKVPPSGLCCLTAFYTPQAIYVRPLTPIATKIFDLVVQDVAAYCCAAEPLETVPNVGEVVGARFAGDKNNFHRALVTGTDGTNSTVIFLDFGSIDKVPLEDLRRIPVAFRKIPTTAVKVGLKDVHYRMFNDLAWDTLRIHVGKANMTLEHDGDLSCVKLLNDNAIVNQLLNKALLPSHISQTNVLTDYFDLKDILWDRWETSVPLEGAVTNILDNNEFCFVHYSHVFDYVREVMTPQITEHCKSLKFTQYVPRLNEFVLVKHTDDWYRAFCDIDPRNPFTATVFFVDYGNTGEVPVEDIRPMAPEFANVPATAKQCVVEGLPSRDDIKDLLKNVTELVVLPGEKEDPLACRVHVPHLETLRRDRLSRPNPVGVSLENGLSPP